MRVNDEQLLGFLQSMNPSQSNNGVKASLRENQALESKTLNNCKQLKVATLKRLLNPDEFG